MKTGKWLLFLLVFVTLSCRDSRVSKITSQAVPWKYAQLLSVDSCVDSLLVTVKNPWKQGETLQHFSISASGSPSSSAVVAPLKRIICFSTAHCQLLAYLGMADRIAGVCDMKYILIPDIQRRVKAGRIADCGDSMNPDVEKIISLRPDAIILSPFEGGGGFGKLERLGVPIIQAADYMEPSALGRAEWMRLYGRLLGCRQRSDSLFHVVDSTYQSLKHYAARLPLGLSILTERKTGSTWYTPGGASWLGTLLKDAHASYAFANDGHSGSLPLSYEQIIAKAGESDVWAFKFNGPEMMTRSDLLHEFYGYNALKAFRTGNIYECNCSITPYFEEVPFRPDYLLREMIQLLHPGVNLGGLRYYRKL